MKALKCLIRSGNTDKIIFFAGVSRNAEIYTLAANYLQTLDWHSRPDLAQSIVTFYTKVRQCSRPSVLYNSPQCNKQPQVLCSSPRCYATALIAPQQPSVLCNSHLMLPVLYSSAHMPRYSKYAFALQLHLLQHLHPKALHARCHKLPHMHA